MALRMDINGDEIHGSVTMNGDINAPQNPSWAGRTLKFNHTPVSCEKMPRKQLETIVEDWLKVKIAAKLRKISYEKAKVLLSDPKGFDWEFTEVKVVQQRSPAEVMGDARKAYNDAEDGADKSAKEQYFRGLVVDMAKGLGIEPNLIAPDLKW